MIVSIKNPIELRPNIYFIKDKKSCSLENVVRKSLDALEEIPIGKRLIEKIGKAPHKIYIKKGNTFLCCNENDEAEVPGKGCSSVILFPKVSALDNSIHRTYNTFKLTVEQKPILVSFGHELIHGYHSSIGKRAENRFRCDPLVWTNDEEYHTIMGFPSKKENRKNPKITENALLSSLGLPERIGHMQPESPNPLLFQRMKLLAKLYNQFCLENRYDGQSKNPPPPIINCNLRDLTSNRVAFLYQMKKPNDLTERKLILNVINKRSPSEDFVKKEFKGEECPKDWLKYLSPSHNGKKIVSVGLFRLSLEEACALDSLTPLLDKD